MTSSHASLPFDRATALALIDPRVHAHPDAPASARRCLAAALAIAIGTGARPDEICALVTDDLGKDVQISTIVIGARLTLHGRSAARTIPLLTPVRNALDTYMRDRRKFAAGDRTLFLWSPATPLRPGDLRTAVARCARARALGEGAQIRSARLTFASALMRANASEDLIAYLTARGGRSRRSTDEADLRNRAAQHVLRLLNRHHVFGARYDEYAGRPNA